MNYLASLPNAISGNEILVFSLDLIVSPELLSDCRDALSEDERIRAARFRVENVRDEFVAARGFLRGLLSRFTGVPPTDIRITLSPLGKPSASGGIAFNLSHSGHRAVFALTRATEVGVDLERFRIIVDWPRLARQFLCAEEWQALMELPPADQPRAFVTCWTRKEALSKASGIPLETVLRQVPVGYRPTQNGGFLIDDAGSGWMIEEVDIGSDFACSLAHRSAGAIVKVYNL